MSTVLDPPQVTGLADVRDAVGLAGRTQLWSLTDQQLAAEIGDALALKAQAEAVLLTRLAEADTRDLARTRGATSMTGWLRGSHLLAPGEAARLTRLARALRGHCPNTGQALAQGSVHLSQAEVITDAIKVLSPDLDPALKTQGEQTLLGLAASHDPIGLGQLGRRLEELLDPDGVQARDEAKIRDHERKAFAKREFSLSPDPYGSAGTIRGRYDAEGGAIIAAILDNLSGPLPAGPDGDKDQRLPGQRRYDAVIEAFRRVLAHPATTSGDGGKAQIRVTIPLDSLIERTGYGVLDSGAQISPTLARKLACDAAIIPAVLDATGQPIDLGRERRLYTGPARTALEIRDGGCVWPGCGRPVPWTEAHHLIPWALGGRSDQTNGALLCRAHHLAIEQGDWEAFHHQGRIWLRPPPTLDPHRRPRINTIHRPLPPQTHWPPGATAEPAP